jgi:hypothetical protein
MRINEQTLGLGERMALPSWLAAQEEAEVRQILRQNDVAFRWFVAGCIAVCSLIVAAMFLT